MFDARRPFGWLFLLLAALTVSAQTPPTTMIVDTVYRADGTPAGGTLLISWPEFTTATGAAVAAGNTGVTLGTGGALSVGLVANANATPANTVYSVVYQLDDGTVKTEYWAVPTTSPTTISAVRTTLGATSSASQMATQQYVNTALAGKANDAAVVHLAGTETIVGAKQFAVAPALPTPVNPSDAANKLYVDNSVQNVGSGSYVSTSGGTMTGPLTLSGNPVAPGQAATKSYVDLGTAGKADLTAGLVPTGEIGTGTANNTLCLHGDSSWGACGSSSNAISIQSVPVAATTPTNNQVMTYVASLGEYAPEAGGGVTAGMQAVKYAPDFAWSQSPATNLSTAGSQTVNLPVCPAGVTATEPWYYVYIAGTGVPEAVLVTGGTCAGNGQAGTLQFTTLNAHPAGYTIVSASGGLQEALIVARFSPTNPGGPSQSGKVIVPPGELQAYARISIRASNVTVDFSGSIVDCYMNDTCILAGDPSNSTAFLDITLLNPRGRPMVVSGQSPFIEVNAQKTRLLNVTTRTPPTGGTFSSYVQVDNDQSFLLDGLDTALATGSSDYGVLCNASVCNPVIYAPGPFSSNAAVGWLKNLNISLQCAGNGIDWQSGNTVKISDSVIEGFAQYGVRAGIKRGGYSGFELDNVYEEVGSCTNPAGAIGEAGVIAQGATVKVEGAVLPTGSVPLFTNTGSTDYRYYIVANSATYGASNPLYAGRALTNGSGNITVTTPDVAGASTFDLLRVTYVAPNNPREQAPFGTGNYAVARNVTRASACANGVCTFTDTQATLQSYTVAAPAYFPLLDFWPGNLILVANHDSGSVLDAATAWVQSAPSDIVGVQGTGAPAVISSTCNALLGWTPLWLSCYTSMAPGTFYDQGALLLAVKPNNDGGFLPNLKGRLNFPTLGTGPGHIITLSDSNFQKTIATANNRPSNDANDAFIGYDQGNGNPATVGISVGAPVSISDYIGNVGDGTNWLERLTPGLKEFKTNVQLDNTLTVAGTAQASSFLTTGAGSWAVEGSYGALSPALAGKSAIGFGASGKLQVSENGGTVVEVAKLDSNGDVSENANTATQLAQAPTQCNGSFVTGIQANGNANCSVADVVELAETGPPNGIPNYGIFWFDSTCHCPKVISNNGQTVQLGLLNVFNLDANTLEEYNGASPQTLNIYGTRTDASDYERMRLGYDTTDGYFFVGSDALGASDPQQGLGLWLQGSLRWVVDTSFNFKPWSDNVKDIGSPTLRPKHVYVGTYADLTGGALATEIPNQGTTGTTLNKLAKVTGSPATAIMASTADTNGVIGVVVDGAGTTLSAQIARGGQAPCAFDGATAAGDYVQISSTIAGDCHDAGASYPSLGQVIGRALSTNASAGTYAMLVAGSEVQAQSGGAGNPAGSLGQLQVFGNGTSFAGNAGIYDGTQFSSSANIPAGQGCGTGSTTPITNDDAGKIQAAICAVPTGSTIYYFTPTGGGTLGSNIFQSPCAYNASTCPSSNSAPNLTSKEVHVILGPGTWNTSVQQGVPLNSTLSGNVPGGFGGGLTGDTDLVWTGGNQSYSTCNGYNCTMTTLCMGPTGTIGSQGYCNDSGGAFSDNQPQIQVDNLRVDCAGAKNVSGLVDNTGEESSRAWNVSVRSCANDWGTTGTNGTGATNELRIGNPGDNNVTENSGPWGDIQLEYGTNCTSTAIPLLVYDDVQTLAGHITLNNIGGGNCPGSASSSAISSLTDSTGTATMVTTAALSQVLGANQWVTITGTNNFNGTFQLLSFNNSTETYTFSHAAEVTENAGTATLPIVAVAGEISGNSVHLANLHIQGATIGLEIGGQATGAGMVIEAVNCDHSQTNCVHISSNHATSGTINGVQCQGGCLGNNILDSQAAYGSGANNVDFYQFGLDIAGAQSWKVLGTLSAGTGTFTGLTANGLALVEQSSSPAASAGQDLFYGLTGSHRPLFNPNSTGALNVVGVGSPAISGDIAKFAANGIDLVDGGASGGMVYPGAGVPNSTGSAWATPYTTTGSGAILALAASPALTGAPTAPTQTTSDSSTDIATDAFVKNQAYAPLASPTFTGSPAAPTASAGDNSTKLATTAYVRGEAQMTFTCPVAGAGATVQYCNWTLPAAITVTGFDLAAGTAPLTCSPYATLQVWDGTAGAEVGSYSITMTSGNNFYSQVTGSTNVSSGHLLRVKVTTAAAGCGTVAAGIVATVTYQMQN